MKPTSHEKGTEIDPRGQPIADSSAAMKSARFEPGDLRDPRRVSEALAHWDELDPAALGALTEDPVNRSRLSMLQAVDGWMHRTAARADARERRAVSADGCPDSEELYDFGRGPGFRALTSARRSAIEDHVESCPDCVQIVATLATPPPLPLDIGPAIEPEPLAAPAPRARPELIAPRRPVLPRKPTSIDQMWKRWAPLAAAAGVLVVGGVWVQSRYGAPATAFPSNPLLRGEAGGPLYFPRDRVLVPSAAIAEAWPVLAGELSFEIEPQPEAQSYRVDVFRHDGSAFAAATPVRSLDGTSPTLALPVASLGAGHYTWRAWALERGLERSLGERDFALVGDGDLTRELESIAGEREPQRSLAAVRALFERGYATDARRIARALPPSAERDAFLGRMPGR